MSENTEAAAVQLRQLTEDPTTTEVSLRNAGKTLFNGDLSGHPLVIEHPKYGPSMRFQVIGKQGKDENVWIPVPASWQSK